MLVKHPIRHRVGATATALAGAAILLGYLALLYKVRYEPMGPQNYHVWGRMVFSFALLLLTLGAGPALFFNRALNWRGLTFLSWISYNLYLWHLAIMDFFWRHHWPIGTGDGHADLRYQIAFNISAISLAVLWTWLLTRFYEQPVLQFFTARFRQPQGYVSPNP
jgi:peptidoglycan/LPS O-acetylase OafA/YrhL